MGSSKEDDETGSEPRNRYKKGNSKRTLDAESVLDSEDSQSSYGTGGDSQPFSWETASNPPAPTPPPPPAPLQETQMNDDGKFLVKASDFQGNNIIVYFISQLGTQISIAKLIPDPTTGETRIMLSTMSVIDEKWSLESKISYLKNTLIRLQSYSSPPKIINVPLDEFKKHFSMYYTDQISHIPLLKKSSDVSEWDDPDQAKESLDRLRVQQVRVTLNPTSSLFQYYPRPTRSIFPPFRY
jgi:hypothetical protein